MSKIFVISPDNTTPSGGVRRLYDHVDILNAAGYESYLVHESKNFKSPWINLATPRKSVSTIKPGIDDFLVIPEIYGYNILNIFPGVKKSHFQPKCI